MYLDPIITRKIIVETFRTGAFRSLSIKIGYPSFNEAEGIYECSVDYGWLLNEIPTDRQRHFSTCIGIDCSEAILRATDMDDRFKSIDDHFEFTLPNGERMVSADQYDLSIRRNKSLEFADAKRKDEKYTSKRHHYLSMIERFEEANKRYKKILRSEE